MATIIALNVSDRSSASIFFSRFLTNFGNFFAKRSIKRTNRPSTAQTKLRKDKKMYTPWPRLEKIDEYARIDQDEMKIKASSYDRTAVSNMKVPTGMGDFVLP